MEHHQRLKESILFAFGHPLVDIQARVDRKFLEKFEDLEQSHGPVEHVAGGATQNAVRVFQWISQRPNIATFVGAVGNDEYAKILQQKAQAVGLSVAFQVHEGQATGTCAVCINGPHRSLIANLGAANSFTIDHLLLAKHRRLYEAAEYYYAASFTITASLDSLMLLAKHATANNKQFMMNLSASYLIKASPFKERLLSLLPYIDVVFGNEVETLAFSEAHNYNTTSIADIAVKIAQHKKINKRRSRLVVITQGSNPVIVATPDGTVRTFEAPNILNENIVDTNGAGDAFVGGFLAQYVQGKPIDECVRCGSWAAAVVIQRCGCTFPRDCNYR